MSISLTQITAPAEEPIGLEDARQFLRLPDGDLAFDELIMDTYIPVATSWVEGWTRRSLITQKWRFAMDEIPRDLIEIPRPPLITVDKIETINDAGAATTFAASKYVVDTENSRIFLDDASEWPTEIRRFRGTVIEFTSGYGTTVESVPIGLRHGILQLIYHLHENPEPIILSMGSRNAAQVIEVPMTIKTSLSTFRHDWL